MATIHDGGAAVRHVILFTRSEAKTPLACCTGSAVTCGVTLFQLYAVLGGRKVWNH